MIAADLGAAAVNDSKDCGGLMRVVPIGFWPAIYSRLRFKIETGWCVANHAAGCTWSMLFLILEWRIKNGYHI